MSKLNRESLLGLKACFQAHQRWQRPLCVFHALLSPLVCALSHPGPFGRPRAYWHSQLFTGIFTDAQMWALLKKNECHIFYCLCLSGMYWILCGSSEVSAVNNSLGLEPQSKQSYIHIYRYICVRIQVQTTSMTRYHERRHAGNCTALLKGCCPI